VVGGEEPSLRLVAPLAGRGYGEVGATSSARKGRGYVKVVSIMIPMKVPAN